MEQQLIKDAVNGDLTAFIWLVEQYKGFLMAVVSPIIQDHHLAEDVLQESFVQVYHSLPGYQGGNFKSWLARIATNKALDYKRKEKRRCRESPMDEMAKNLNSYGSSVEDVVIHGETKERLSKLLQELPQAYRRTLSSFYIEEQSYAQLAAQEGLSVKAIEARLYRARKTLKAKWKED
ncbi:MAG: RNA polymerase sigma factor [Bacillota bacterium]